MHISAVSGILMVALLSICALISVASAGIVLDDVEGYVPFHDAPQQLYPNSGNPYMQWAAAKRGANIMLDDVQGYVPFHDAPQQFYPNSGNPYMQWAAAKQGARANVYGIVKRRHYVSWQPLRHSTRHGGLHFRK